jgi:hypothetical protein
MPVENTATIKASTRLAKVLELHPDLLEYIVSLEPHDFARLHNPVMRKLMAPRITLARVAVMAGVPLPKFLERVALLTGAKVGQDEVEVLLPQSASQPPAWVLAAKDSSVRTVDLLALDDALEQDPMPVVMLEVKKLRAGEVLLIRHRWEPQPFYDVWSKMPGYQWFSEQVSDDEWQIWLRRH